jgi:hypothetical protein
MSIVELGTAFRYINLGAFDHLKGWIAPQLEQWDTSITKTLREFSKNEY